MRLAVDFPPGRSGESDPGVVTIELAAVSDQRESLVSSTRFASPADLESRLKAGALVFEHVPTEVLVWLRIVVRSKSGAVVCSYARSYFLQYPDEPRTTLLGVTRALDESGYLGNFVVDRDGALSVSFARSR